MSRIESPCGPDKVVHDAPLPGLVVQYSGKRLQKTGGNAVLRTKTEFLFDTAGVAYVGPVMTRVIRKRRNTGS